MTGHHRPPAAPRRTFSSGQRALLWAAGVLGTLAIVIAVLIVVNARDDRLNQNQPPPTVTDTVTPGQEPAGEAPPEGAPEEPAAEPQHWSPQNWTPGPRTEDADVNPGRSVVLFTAHDPARPTVPTDEIPQ